MKTGRRHYKLFSVFNESKWMVDVRGSHMESFCNRSYVYHKKINAGDVFKVRIENEWFYAIAQTSLHMRRRWLMCVLNDDGFKYYQSLAVENRL
jgi:hypothetical protein